MVDRKSEILKRIKSLNRLISKRETELHVLETELCEICDCSNFEIKERREDGSYYDRSHTYEYKVCNDCGRRFDEKLIYTGGYG